MDWIFFFVQLAVLIGSFVVMYAMGCYAWYAWVRRAICRHVWIHHGAFLSVCAKCELLKQTRLPPPEVQ